MPIQNPFRVVLLTVPIVCAFFLGGPESHGGQETIVPQTAMSLCPALTVATREMVPAGTAIGVSPDGRYLVQYIHTTQGVELKLRNRDTGEDRSVQLEPPSLPPGVTWQVHEIIFSPSGSLFAVRSVGAIWVLDAETAQVRYQIGVDGEKQAYPGKAALAEGQMAAVFWPPESYLADAVPKKPIEVRFYEAATGKVLRSLSLALDSAERWTKLALAPDGSRLAVLLRSTRWPGKARLRVYASEDGKLLWERKIGAEDMAWLGDGRDLLVLGSQLSWLDAGTGNKRRDAEKSVHSSESQILRVNERGNLAVGHLPRYSKLKRALFLSDRRDPRLLVWRLDTGKELCQLGPRAAEGADVWPTARGELIALEESYEVRPPLRLLRGASIVTYRVAPH